jgi:hypothetical protein
MEDFAELMQRLLEIQSGGRQRSPKLTAEDERSMEHLQRGTLTRKPPQPVHPTGQGSSTPVPFKI